ncbi:sugar ABC transporter ATP-binding protein, partial [Klebsiella pneumoniae]|uniref:sugar ABC transporter ATP-binding protein n=1 Tax=Klebsiella pneumoniae TaxID=573 RepID=UPI00109D0FA4
SWLWGTSMIPRGPNWGPHMTVAENIWLGREPMKYGFVDHGQLTRQTQALLDKLNIRLTADRLVGDLSIAAQQMVEIAKAVSWNADIVIMDEPTSALTEGEVAHLFTIIRDLRAQGKAIIYISHKMDEIFAITDEISVFRDGTWVGSKNTTEFTRQSLITQMVGRELTQLFPKFNNTIGEEVLTVRNLTRQGVFHDVSFSVRRGEILGVAGLVGAGRSEVMESLFGMERFDSGEVLIDGAPVTIDSPSVAIEKGMALLTEDRKKSGLFLVLSVLENMSIVKMPEYIGKSGFVQHVKMAEDCMEQIRRLNIKTPTMDQIINNLSGGNQQKVLIARWLLAQPKILILDEPTRGIDVGAKAEIYHLISELANRGVAVIMVSSELPEILGMSDRVMVMHEGRITGILEKDEADQETILSLASH